MGPRSPRSARLIVSGIAGLTWTSNREVVFTRVNLTGRGLWRVPADGGQPVEFSQFDSAQRGAAATRRRARPPDGKLVFYSSTRASILDLKIGVVSTASGKTKVFTDLLGARVLGLADGFLLYVRIDGALMAVPFDPGTLRGRSTAPDPRQHRDAWLAVAGGAFRQWDAALPARRHWPASWCGSISTVYARAPSRFGAGLRSPSALSRRATHRLRIPGRRGQRDLDRRPRRPDRRAAHPGGIQRPARMDAGRKPGDVRLRTNHREFALVATGRRQRSRGDALSGTGRDSRSGIRPDGGDEIVYRMDTPDSNRDIYRLPLVGRAEAGAAASEHRRRQAAPRLARRKVARLRLQRVRTGRGVCHDRWPAAHGSPSRATAAGNRSGRLMGSGSTIGLVPD